MSRKHPSFEELGKKHRNIEIERAKTSISMPVKAVKSEGGVVWVARPNPLPRLGHIPFEVITRSAKQRHDLRGLCANEKCAYKNSTEDDLINKLVFQNIEEVPAQ